MKDYTKIKIEDLTKERKRLDKELKKLNRKIGILKFVELEVSCGGYHSRSCPKGWIIGGIISLILCFSSLIFLPSPLQFICFGAGLLPTAVSVVGSMCFYDKLLRKHNEKKNVLSKEREELVKQIDCLRLGEVYIAPQPKIENVKNENGFAVFQKLLKQTKEKHKQSLLEKARLRHIEVDKVLQGSKAFDSKREFKEAKKDLKNFLEEQNEEISSII